MRSYFNKHLFLLIALGLVLIWFHTGRQASVHFSSYGRGDFAVFYATGVAVRQGQNPYDPHILKKIIRHIRPYEAGFRFLYPPLTAGLFVPFTALSFSVATWLWIIINYMLLFLVLWCTQYLVRRRYSLLEWCLVIVLCSVYTPLFSNFRLGQVNLLLTLFFVLHIIFLQRKNWIWSGVFLAGLILFKLFPVGLLGLYVLRRQWKLVLATCISLGVMLSLSVAVFGVQLHKDYLTVAQKLATQGISKKDLISYDNASLYGTLARVDNIPWLNSVYVVLVGLTLTWVVYSTIRLTDQKTNWLWLATSWMACILFISKEIHSQYFLFLLPFFIVYFVKHRINQQRNQFIVFALSYLCFAIGLDAYPLLLTLPIINIIPLGVVGLGLFLYYSVSTPHTLH